jgi:hypothetical protein
MSDWFRKGSTNPTALARYSGAQPNWNDIESNGEDQGKATINSTRTVE